MPGVNPCVGNVMYDLTLTIVCSRTWTMMGHAILSDDENNKATTSTSTKL